MVRRTAAMRGFAHLPTGGESELGLAPETDGKAAEACPDGCDSDVDLDSVVMPATDGDAAAADAGMPDNRASPTPNNETWDGSSSLLGEHVRLRGLKAQTDLNGQVGVATEFDSNTLRYTVELASGQGVIKVKADVLEVLERRLDSIGEDMWRSPKVHDQDVRGVLICVLSAVVASSIITVVGLWFASSPSAHGPDSPVSELKVSLFHAIGVVAYPSMPPQLPPPPSSPSPFAPPPSPSPPPPPAIPPIPSGPHVAMPPAPPGLDYCCCRVAGKVATLYSGFCTFNHGECESEGSCAPETP